MFFEKQQNKIWDKNSDSCSNTCRFFIVFRNNHQKNNQIICIDLETVSLSILVPGQLSIRKTVERSDEMRIVDLSVPIVDGLPVDPPPQIAHIDYIDHEEGCESMLPFFPGAKKEDLPDGCAWASEYVHVTSHSGTHMDAPWHFHPTMNGGEPSWTIDQVPLEWCFGDGVMVDFYNKPDGYVCTPEDFISYFNEISYSLKPGDIVLVRTSAMDFWGTGQYLTKGCGVGREATIWLYEQGVRVVGIDSWSWDPPLNLVGKKFAETKDPSIIWEGHKAGKDIIYCQMEKVANLDKLPPVGFKVICLPIKIQGASAGWVRCVALFDE